MLLPSPLVAARLQAVQQHRDHGQQAKQARKCRGGKRGTLQAQGSPQRPVAERKAKDFTVPDSLTVNGTELLQHQEQLAAAAVQQLLEIVRTAPPPILVPGVDTGIGIDVLFTRDAARVPPNLLKPLLKTHIYNNTFININLKARTTSSYPSTVLGIAWGEPRPNPEIHTLLVRGALSLEGMATRRLLELLHFQKDEGWMKVCGASGRIRIRNMLHNVKNILAMRGYGLQPEQLQTIDIKGSTARAHYRNAKGEEKSFQLGNLLSREIWTTTQVEHLQPLVSEYLKNVEDVYAAHAAKVLRGWKGLKDAHIPFLELKLERIASNAVTPSKGLLAIHKDRRMALPGILTRSTLDVPYDGGDLVLIDGYLIVDYTEEDAVLFWGDEVAHAVLPPIPRGPREKGMEPIRMSFFHFTKKGRKKPPPRASAEELQAWVAVTYFGGVAPDEEGGGGRRVRSRRG